MPKNQSNISEIFFSPELVSEKVTTPYGLVISKIYTETGYIIEYKDGDGSPFYRKLEKGKMSFSSDLKHWFPSLRQMSNYECDSALFYALKFSVLICAIGGIIFFLLNRLYP